MRYLLQLLTTLAWALWLGGFIALFLFVQTMFKQDRPTAVVAAPILFNAFERYELILAAVALLSTAILFTLTRSRPTLILASLFLLTTLIGLTSSLTITSKMNTLRETGQSSTPQFRKLHAYSSITYLTQTALLLTATFLLPFPQRKRP